MREVLKSFEKGKFIVIFVDVFMNHTMRFNKDDALFNSFKDPEDKIRVEPFIFIETNPFAATLGCVREKSLSDGDVFRGIDGDTDLNLLQSLFRCLPKREA